jgi:arsenate reductase
LRFFRERRVPVTFVNLAQRSIAPTELRRFTSRLGAATLLDKESRAYRELGLAYMSLGDDQIIERLLSDQGLLRVPLVRSGDRLAVGDDEKAWRELVAPRQRVPRRET